MKAVLYTGYGPLKVLQLGPAFLLPNLKVKRKLW
jgi:hypothetical protein